MFKNHYKIIGVAGVAFFVFFSLFQVGAPSAAAQSLLRDFEIEANYYRQALPGSDNLLDYLLDTFRTKLPQDSQLDFSTIYPQGSSGAFGNFGNQNSGVANTPFKPKFRFVNAKPQKTPIKVNPIDLIQRPKLVDTTHALRPIKLDALNSYVAEPGDIMTVFGRNLPVDKQTRVYIDDVYKSHLVGVSASGTYANFQVPQLEVGAYEIYLKTDRHKSNTVPLFIESDNATTTERFQPLIDSITPQFISESGLVTIHGQNFAADHNALVTTFGVLYDLNSHANGTALTFYLDLDELDRLKKLPNQQSTDLYFQIINKNGSGNVFSGVSLEL